MSEAPSRRSFLASVGAAAGSAAVPGSATATEQRHVHVTEPDYPDDIATIQITGAVEGLFEEVLDILDQTHHYKDPVERSNVVGVNIAVDELTTVDLDTPVVSDGESYDWARPWSDETGHAASFIDDSATNVAQHLADNVSGVTGQYTQSVEATPNRIEVTEARLPR